MAQRLPFLFIAESPLHGRGVFTGEPLNEGDLIEICPVIVLPPEQLKTIHNSKLHDYYFLWGPEQDRPAIALGYGSIYNHSYEANANYRFDYDSETIDFYAVKAIAAGEEITVNYNGDPNDPKPVWFDQNLTRKLK
ncbi:MAG: SET domain-containing protein-lysine N-methyltransferase [Saprospiraceae bacterium]|jgi:hypothetical protein